MDRLEPPSLVRCVDCHAVYEPPAEARGDDAGRGCPECGEQVWLAADVPLPEPAQNAPA